MSSMIKKSKKDKNGITMKYLYKNLLDGKGDANEFVQRKDEQFTHLPKEVQKLAFLMRNRLENDIATKSVNDGTRRDVAQMDVIKGYYESFVNRVDGDRMSIEVDTIIKNDDDLNSSSSSSKPPVPERRRSSVESNPNTNQSNVVVNKDLTRKLGINFNDTVSLIESLADGLSFDAFNSVRMREYIASRKIDFDFDTCLVVISSYIFIGNNTSRLSNKVRSKDLGNKVAEFLSGLGVQKRRVDADTLTLSRIAIAYAPITYWIRLKLNKASKLPNSGINTQLPRVLQDVSLSGVQPLIAQSENDRMFDYLTEFTLALRRYKEKEENIRKEDRMSLEEISREAEKYRDIAISGANSDQLISNFEWSNPTEKRVRKFFDKANVSAQSQ